ncbi:MAG: substrate-binding domain-containing protein, partial [Deinococcota bacterium]
LSDLLAYGVLHYCNEKGTRVALTGFDDDLLADVLELTSVKQPIERAAALLVEQLMIQIQGDRTPVQHLLDAELIVRSSSQIMLD